MKLSDVLAERARERPDRVFLRTSEGDFGYAEVSMMASRLANGLALLGTQPAEPVALLMHNSADQAMCLFAISELGGVAVPLNTALRGSSLSHMLQLTQSRTIIIDEALAPNLLAIVDELPSLRNVIFRDAVLDARVEGSGLQLLDFSSLSINTPHDPVIAIDDLAAGMMLFTSGTTGPSKACVLSHRYLLRQGQLHAKYLGLTESDVLYCPFPLFHIDAVTLTVVAALSIGATAAIGPRFSASHFWDEVIRFDATVFDFMGATLTILWKQPRSAKERQHRVRLAWGVPMPEWQAEWEERFGFRLYELYGMTDAGIPVYDLLDQLHRPGSCGRVIDEFEVAIGDGAGDLVPTGQIGEILVRPRETGTVMTEYFSMPLETLDAFRGLWFHTGDLGRLDDDGFLYFLGRKKDSIRRRGENISAFEVEQLVTSHPAVLEAAAIGVPSELSEEDVKVCVVLRPGETLEAEELLIYCSEHAAPFMVPRYVEFLLELPKTPTLKVEKFRLRANGVTSTTWDASLGSAASVVNERTAQC